ncbi:hypothetical protein C8F04DRAFT_1265260 [Mycena alexandri]|uniref:DUF6534 domain-containing protein n=1 Tax=Mycena alexandri TaxID=1745969 RepID=A0AAD6SJJ1_9AGAR|nr:hypothetical protein C8F04DRAFT_1265260 [Mycena alexandri]
MAFNPDIILGALLVGTWASSVLYTVEIIQAVYYYRHFKRDNWMLKLLVSSAIAIDSVSMIANYSAVYLNTITHFGDLAYLKNQYWAMTALAQSFLTARYWLLTKNKPITLILFFFITVAAGGAFASGVTLAIFTQYEDRGKVEIPGIIWLVTEAVTDVSIASALLLQFRKVRTSFKESRSLLNRLVAQTIQTGGAGATIALVALVAFLTNEENNIPTAFGYCVGHVYCITMLANLNNRKTGKTWSGNGTSSGTHPETRGAHGRVNLEQSEGGAEYGGICVFRTDVVHIDTLEGVSKGSFRTNPGQGLPEDSPTIEIEMTVNDAASYSSKQQDVFAL